jgi:hypothetical protein
MSIMAVRRGAPLCFAAALALGFACQGQESGDGGETAGSAGQVAEAGPRPIERGEPETLDGHLYLRMTNDHGLESGESPMDMVLTADDDGYYLPLYNRILVIEHGATKPRYIKAPDGVTLLRGIHNGELIVQDTERGQIFAVPKAGGEPRTIAPQGFKELVVLVGDRLVALESDSVVTHVPVAGGPVQTILDRVGYEVLTDHSVRGDAILWGAHKDRSVILVSRGSLETVEVVHELDDTSAKILGVAWLGDDVVFAVDKPGPAFFRKVGDTVDRLDIELPMAPMMWTDGNSTWWVIRRNDAVVKAGRIDSDSSHELLSPPANMFPAPGGATWSVQHGGVTNYYVHRPAPSGAVPLSIDQAALQELGFALAQHYKGPEPKIEIEIVDRTAKTNRKTRELMQKLAVLRIEKCYQAALVLDPSLAGQVVLELEIEENKVIKAAAVGEFSNPDVSQCLADNAMEWTVLLLDGDQSGTMTATIKLSVPA